MSWEVGTPIPDDWVEEVDGYAVGLFLFPNSPRWGLVVRTVLRVLSRGRFWRRDSGTITKAQDAGRLAYMSFTYVSFAELLGAIGGVRDAIEALKLQTQVNVACCDQLSPPDPPVPPPEELPPPGSGGGDVPPAYGGDAGAYDAELCRSANALHWLVRRYLVALTRLDTVGGAIAVAVALLAIVFPEPASTAIGGVSLTAIVAALVLIEGGLDTVAAWAEDAITYWDSVQQELVCSFYLRIGLAESWKDGVAGEIVSRLQSVVSAAPMPDSAIATAVDWLAALLDWMERDIYDNLSTLDSHPEPIDCTVCENIDLGDYQIVPVNIAAINDPVPPVWLTFEGNRIMHGQTVDHSGHGVTFDTLTTPASIVGVAMRIAKIEAATPPLSLEMVPNSDPDGRWADSAADRDYYDESHEGAWWVHTETSEQYTAVANGLLAAGYADVRGGTSFRSGYPQPYGHAWKNDRGESREIIMEAHLIISVGGA
jgi:hypothetical protein